MHKRIGIIALMCFILLTISSVTVMPSAHGWIYPSDTNEREYYPGSKYYPEKFYEIYTEKYARVYVKDIVLSMSYGHEVKVGTLVFTITPITHISGDAETNIGGKTREFLIDVEIIYNAGSYPRNEPALRYLDEPDDYNHQSWELPPINAFYLEKTELKAELSEYTAPWRVMADFGGTSAANWVGTWKLNGNINTDNNWDAYMSKSENSQFVAEGINVEQNLHDAYIKWRNHLLNQIENDAELLKTYNEYTSLMSSGGYLLNLISLGAGNLPGLGIAQGTLGIGQFIYSMYESEIITEMVEDVGRLNDWQWHSADTKGNYLDAVADYIYPQPDKKSAQEDMDDGTYDSYDFYFWHYKNWIVASHLTFDFGISVVQMPPTTNPQTPMDVPITFTVWFHYGPPGYGQSYPYTFTTTLKLAVTEEDNPNAAPKSFGLPMITVKDKNTGETIPYDPAHPTQKIINKGELYEFYLKIPNSPVSKVNYYVDWGKNSYTEINDANPFANTYVSHVWWSAPEPYGAHPPYLQIFAYYKSGDTVLLSQVFRIELVWQDNGNTPGGGCPFLYTYSGNSWREENNVLVWAENATRPFLETGDFYLFNATENNERVTIGIGEPGEDVDYIDAVKLYKVDAPEGYEVAESYTGMVYAYREVESGIAKDNHGENVTSLIGEEDGNYWIGDKGDYVDITLNLSSENLLVIRGIDNPPEPQRLRWGDNNPPHTQSTMWIYANVSDEWIKLGEIKVRHNLHTNVVNLDLLHLLLGDKVELRFEMRDRNGIDFIGVAHDYRLASLERVNLEESNYGYENISEVDGNYLRLNPGDFVRLSFESKGDGLYLLAIYGFYFNHEMIGKGIGIARADEVNIAEAELQSEIESNVSYVLLPLLENYNGICSIMWYVDGTYVPGDKPVVSFDAGVHTIELRILRSSGIWENYSLQLSVF